MSDYVSRQAVIEAMLKASTPAFDKNGKPTFLVDYVRVMENLPSADVIETKMLTDTFLTAFYRKFAEAIEKEICGERKETE